MPKGYSGIYKKISIINPGEMAKRIYIILLQSVMIIIDTGLYSKASSFL